MLSVISFARQIVMTTVPTVKLLINGEFVESQTTQWRDVVNPATQQVLAVSYTHLRAHET